MKQTTKEESASAFEPLRKLYRRYILGGGLLALVFGAVQLATIESPVGSGLLGVVIGAGLLAFGVWGLRVGGAAQVLALSLNRIQGGRLRDAEKLLDEVEKNNSTLIVTSRSVQRAMIALGRGDLDEAELRAGQAIAAQRPMVGRAGYDMERGNAFGMRAWARAAKGDIKGAMSDVRAVREALVPSPDALAYASLAEVMVLERRGERAQLSAILRRDRRLLLGRLGMRERAVVRAIQRLLKTSPTSVYRVPHAPKQVESEDEPTIAEWIDRVAPQLSEFAPAPNVALNQGPRLIPTLVPTASGIEKIKSAAPKKGFPIPAKLLGLWAGLIIMFLAIWQFLAPDEPPRRPSPRLPQPPAPEPPSPLLMPTVSVVLVASVVGMVVWMVRRNQARSRRLQRLSAAVAVGEDVDRELIELSRSGQPLIAAQADLLRASVAERRGAFEEGLSHIDAARGRLRTHAEHAAASILLSPLLTGTRAYLLAAAGRGDEAAAELASLPLDYAFLDRTRFAVTLVALLAKGDVDSASQLSAATPLELFLGPRDELMRDLVRAATAPGGAGPAEIARLRDELREDDESRGWIKKVAPVLLARFEQQVGEGDEREEKE